MVSVASTTSRLSSQYSGKATLNPYDLSSNRPEISRTLLNVVYEEEGEEDREGPKVPPGIPEIPPEERQKEIDEAIEHSLISPVERN